MNRYSEYRNQIRSGDLLAWSHRPWGSIYDFKIQMVRVFTRSEYSHVAVAWVVGGRVFVIEAVEPLVRIYPLSKLGSFYTVPMSASWKPETEEAALNFVGSPYSEKVAMKAFFQKLPEGTVAECAALVLEVYKREGVKLGDRATPDSIVREALSLGRPLYLIQGN